MSATFAVFAAGALVDGLVRSEWVTVLTSAAFLVLLLAALRAGQRQLGSGRALDDDKEESRRADPTRRDS